MDDIINKLSAIEDMSQSYIDDAILKKKDIAAEMGDKVQPVFDLSVSADNSDGGLTKTAASLVKGRISEPIKTLSGDGYYFVVLNNIEGNTVNYSYIKVPLTEFNKQFNNLKTNPNFFLTSFSLKA